MTTDERLLRQVRLAAAAVRERTGDAEARALLDAMDVALNTLQLRTDTSFTLAYIEQGRALLAQGRRLRNGDRAAARADAALLALTKELRAEVLDAEIQRLHADLAQVVTGLDEGRSAAEKAFLTTLSAWEAGLYGHQARPAASHSAVPTPAGRNELDAPAFEAYLQQRLPQRAGLKVVGFTRLTGGFSKLTVLVDLQDDAGVRESIVIRADQPVDILRYEGSDLAQEFHMIALMQRAGLPIAEPLWLELDTGHFGRRFIVSRKAVGTTVGGNVGSAGALPAPLLDDIVGTLVQLHRVEVGPDDALAQRSHLREWLPHRSVREAAAYNATHYLPRLMRLTGIPASPQLTRGVKWLQDNLPDGDEPAVIVHVDFALNNLIVDGNRVTAVLDWESSRLGDPADDLIWTQQNLAAHLSLDELLERHAAGTGRRISAYRLAYARVAKCALNAISCMSGTQALLTHDAAPVKLALLAYQYMALFGAQFNELIEQAERLRATPQAPAR